ncbi:RdgB/HAM1 family non-canonical purine NTP pyrophosphatase [Cesiribacter andamanensis]|uniref:dITP/XTP pyrophosphatase n=1 Tax=Cesiribacter andamanensis AMV16 TaxID=1279009 RepID=M7NRG9_9BACT|nr:RdgB/HAM1 family non-canonical purine NTP pyrophosphatase [Cesiribacter andamanensis]EMR01109.1 Non-canonical purine NTP pyrophosphatase [Cesiribacter andamanensis AMV16]
MTLCFATNNPKKLAEIRAYLGEGWQVLGLEEIGCREELPETGNTLEANSLQKARWVWDHYQIACFADDTGLEVEALNGEPGVYSARYAGPHRSNADNVALLLQKLRHEPKRAARFRTVLSYISPEGVQQFEGEVRGSIIDTPRGEEGFGYDPVFVPEGHSRTFAEMSLAEKNSMSHRARAMKKLAEYLKQIAK